MCLIYFALFGLSQNLNTDDNDVDKYAVSDPRGAGDEWTEILRF